MMGGMMGMGAMPAGMSPDGERPANNAMTPPSGTNDMPGSDGGGDSGSTSMMAGPDGGGDEGSLTTMWSGFVKSMVPVITRVVNFSKQLPGQFP